MQKCCDPRASIALITGRIGRQKGRNGQAACTVVGVIVTVAVGYLMANGVCSGGRTLYVYTGSNRNLHAACAYRAPYT